MRQTQVPPSEQSEALSYPTFKTERGGQAHPSVHIGHELTQRARRRNAEAIIRGVLAHAVAPPAHVLEARAAQARIGPRVARWQHPTLAVVRRL